MNLYDYCKEESIEVNLACEVGFYRLEDSQIKEFIKNGTECWIFDVQSISDDISNYDTTFFNLGIGYSTVSHGEFKLAGASTFGICEKNPPVIANNNYTKKTSIFKKVHTFDEFDIGLIDLISIDIEGMEWAVLSRMRSLPKIIEIEMKWKKYINPHYDTIKHWMKINGYIFLERDGSDYIYRRAT